MANFGIAAALAALALGTSRKIYGFENIRRHTQRAGYRKNRNTFHPKINRHTGKPHEHKREIARNLRQAEARGAAQ